MSEVSNNWISLSDCFYDKVELYSGVFSNVSSSAIVVSGQFGGPVLILDKNIVTVLTSSGEQISQWRWNNGPAAAADWSHTEEAVFVLEDGTVLIYSMFGIFKSTFSMGQEAKDIKILSAKIFTSHLGTGVAIMTTTHRFYIVSSIVEPRLRKLYDSGEMTSPDGWCPLSNDKQSRLVVGRASDLVILSVNDMSVLEVDIGTGQSVGSSVGKVVRVVTSHSQTKVCVVLDTGLVWLGTMTRTMVTHQMETVATNVAWCGEDAVLLTTDTGTGVLLHRSGVTETLFQPMPLAMVQECDGVRIISQGFHDLIHRVDKSVQDIYRIGSMAPGAILLMASQALAARSHKADEYIRMIQDKLSVAVKQCISAAGALFQADHQKELMRAAKFGTAFLKAGTSSEDFYHQCTTLKLLNNVRHYKVGIPITQVQLEAMSRPVLMDRLIARRLFPLAMEISEFLKLSPADGKSRVLAHWAMYKVETSVEDESETARMVSSRLGLCPDISYSDIAEKAAECGKKQLGVQLLEHEVRADKQVPLLMKLGQGAQALRKAIYSGDTDLIYHVILTLQDLHSPAEFHMIIRQDPVASKLYSLYCRQHSQASLGDWLRQEDDFSSMGRISYQESYSTGRVETRLSHLVSAQDQYKRCKQDFNANIADENHRLLKYQTGLEEKFGKPFLNLSLQETLIKLIEDKETKLADKLKSEFKVSDRRYFWMKVRAFGDRQQWAELNNLAKSKKSPIGFGPFIDQCLKHGEKGQASKYLPLLNVEEKLRYCVKLGMIQEAADAAFTLRDMNALTMLEIKANNNISLLELISGYKQKLQMGAR